MEPLVTVLLPVYNGQEYIRLAIDSVLAQTYKHLELLIVDDGSTDNTVAVVRSYADARVKLVAKEKNSGIVDTMNTGIDHAAGEYIARMDADDICKPQRLQKQAAYLQAHPEVTMVDTIMEYIDGKGALLNKYNNNITTEEAIKKAMLVGNCLGHSSIMMRTAEYRKYKYRKIWYEDDDLWLRLLNDGKRIHKIAEPLLLYRIHEGSIMKKDKAKNQSLAKFISTRWHYYSRLSFKDKLKPMNVFIVAGLMKQRAVWLYKKLKER